MQAGVKSNITKIYLFKFFTSMSFVGSVMVPFLIEWGGMSFFQVMMLQSWFMFWIIVFDVPAGAFADRFGRKMSMVLSCTITIAAAVVYASTPSFYVFLVAEFLWAVSFAVMYGAGEAFVYDSLKHTNRAQDSKRVFIRKESIGLAGILVSAPFGSLIAAKFGLNIPMLMTAVPMIAALVVAFSFKERRELRKIHSIRYFDGLKKSIAFFYGNSILKILAADMIFIGVISYFMIWLYQPILKQGGLGIAYFGAFYAAISVCQIAVMNGYVRLERILGSKRSLLFLSSAMTGLMFMVSGAASFLPIIMAAIILTLGFGSSRRPLLISYMNKHIPSGKRATVMSTIDAIESLAIVIMNPVIGAMAEWSLGYTTMILGSAALAFSFISRVEESHLID